MRILISGVCGFVGTSLARALAQSGGHELFGFDNFIRPGSETNRAGLKQLGVRIFHCDLRAASDLESLPPCDWVIDAAANPSVLAGVDGQTSSRQLIEHNLGGTINTLEYCKRHHAGMILLSTSRVYSIRSLAALPVRVEGNAFVVAEATAQASSAVADYARPRPTPPATGGDAPRGLTAGVGSNGVREDFSTTAPISLYGATKLASEALALEYGEAFGLPVFVNRCGVLAGAGQFGRADQGIFAYWINTWLRDRPLRYIGFGGQGHQVRDCLHPRDLASLISLQLAAPKLEIPDRIVNLGGGIASAKSLRQLSDWCASRFGARTVMPDPAPRAFDIPWLVLDAAKAARVWNWRPQTAVEGVLDEIAIHAQAHPEWLDLSAAL